MVHGHTAMIISYHKKANASKSLWNITTVGLLTLFLPSWVPPLQKCATLALYKPKETLTIARGSVPSRVVPGQGIRKHEFVSIFWTKLWSLKTSKAIGIQNSNWEARDCLQYTEYQTYWPWPALNSTDRNGNSHRAKINRALARIC